MKVLKQLLGRFSRTKVKKVAATAAVFVLVSGATAVGVSAVSGKSTDAAVSACGANSSNSIIRNGASSRKAFIADVKKSSELQAFYKNFGLSPNDYNRFVSDAKPGVAYDNNTIVVDGNVVANSVGSTGRLQGCQGSNPRVFHIAGKNFYGNMNSKAFASGTHAIPVDVLFDGNGKIQFAVMTSVCGNATYQHPVPPTMECKELHA
ncbi:MAG TPA: hypothetical protein VFH39_02250, partial [Candidatus Saccharimonadales bacterium]|nr:hypothetical protein [Candidatus Saccharimonadales bacterium]